MIKEVVQSVKNAFVGKGREERKRFGALDARGSEVVSSTPMQPPLGYNPQPSMFDVMRKMISDHQKALESAGYETPEEADDFDVDDDFDPSSPYEHSFDPPADPAKLPPEVPAAPEKAANPPADGPGTPPAHPAPAGSPAPAQGGPA